MTQLFLEMGNTQLKASLLQNNDYEFLGSAAHQNLDVDSALDLLSLHDIHPAQVYIASVADSAINAKLIDAIQTAWKVYPTLLTTQPSCCGIECGYDEFDRLGVDRWMAIIGACAHSNKPTLIVDAGTALTIDVVVDKQHQGGFIVPGLGLMRQSLLEKTALPKQAFEIEQESLTLLAKDTGHGIMGGTLYMVASYLNNVIHDLESEMGRRFDCIGTGGDFEAIQPLLDKSFDYVEDLTLQGMIEVIESL